MINFFFIKAASLQKLEAENQEAADKLRDAVQRGGESSNNIASNLNFYALFRKVITFVPNTTAQMAVEEK